MQLLNAKSMQYRARKCIREDINIRHVIKKDGLARLNIVCVNIVAKFLYHIIKDDIVLDTVRLYITIN
jgi:hypothetical protein